MKKIFDTTYLYSFLIFIGFYNYYSFYSYFDIEIFSYLTFSELLLSFLDLTFPFLIVPLYIISLFFIAMFYPNSNNKKEDDKINKEINVFPYDSSIKGEIESIKKYYIEKKWVKLFLFLPLNLFYIIIKFFLILLTYFYAILILIILLYQKMDSHFPILFLIIFSIPWFFLIHNKISEKYKEFDLFVKYIMIFVFLFISTSFISISNRQKAKSLLNGFPNYAIKFDFNKSTITSNSNLIYLGTTEKFIFLRDLKLNENYIYSRSEIKLIKLKKRK